MQQLNEYIVGDLQDKRELGLLGANTEVIQDHVLVLIRKFSSAALSRLGSSNVVQDFLVHILIFLFTAHVS